MEERINPAKLTDKETGEVYELDFSRGSVRFAEQRGFLLENVAKYPVTGIEDLFFYAFRKNHRKVTKEKTDKLLEKLGGVPEKLLVRLIDLYNQALTSNSIQADEDVEKNERMGVEL